MESPAGAKSPVVPEVTDPSLLFNRELSWLHFNERVRLQIEDGQHKLLDQVKFLSIYATNLEEFVMVRVASHLRKVRAGVEDVSPDGQTTSALLKVIRKRIAEMLREQSRAWTDVLRPRLREQGLRFLDWSDLTPPMIEHLSRHFEREIAPALTPLAFDPGHPFPFISNQSLNLAVVVKDGRHARFARVKIPDVLPRFIPLPASVSSGATKTFVFLEDVIRANVGKLFPDTTVQSSYLFRVVRDADLVIQEDEADDLLESIDRGLRESRRGALAMLQVESTISRRVLEILIENFEIEDEQVYKLSGRLGFGDWMAIAALPRPDLKAPPFAPLEIWPPEPPDDLFARLRQRDWLVHHPFESFSAVEDLVRAAVDDPAVVAIKMTLYRIGTNSPLVDLLVEAAEAGKQVAVLVELKARFDERNNIKWATRLEAAGVHVAYGLVNLKTHAKLCLVVRKDLDGLRRYVHVGTGNYNANTARVYTDLGLFTTHHAIAEDTTDVLNYLTGYSNRRDYRTLLVAPTSLRSRITALIDAERVNAEAGHPAHVIIKVNALTDVEIIRALYRASQAGVTVELIVRGTCCLRPGVPGVSDHITVRSIVGPFLEHSRIYWFHHGGDPRLYIGSADLMERSLDRRVEVLCPVLDHELRSVLRDTVLDMLLRDNTRAHRLRPDGRYELIEAEDGAPVVDAQLDLLAWYGARRSLDRE